MSGTVRQVADWLRARGVVVHEWAGCYGRSAGGSPDFVGGIVHHTGSGTAPGWAYQTLVSGRSDLAGPLCNFAGNVDGSLTIIADGVANHAGASGGRSMGPLPVTKSFNRRVMGIEIVYPGSSPMSSAQYRTACLWAKAVATICGGGNIESVRAHAETSITGKWDPGYAPGRTIDMAQFRRDSNASTGVQKSVSLQTKHEDVMSQLRPVPVAGTPGKYRFHKNLQNWDMIDGYYITTSSGWSTCEVKVFIKKADGSYVSVPSELPWASGTKYLVYTLAEDDIYSFGLPEGARSIKVEITCTSNPADGVPDCSLFSDITPG
jgi:hypothetical protein